jgi:opacity protein-like surface antigen
MFQGNGDADTTFHINNNVSVPGPAIENVSGRSHTESSEISVGVLYVADTGSIRPYVGAGMSFIKADANYSFAGGSPNFLTGSNSGSGSTQGYYLHTGVDMVLDGNMTLGLDYRRVMGTDDIQFFNGGDFGGDDVGMDSSTISIVLGYGF